MEQLIIVVPAVLLFIELWVYGRFANKANLL